MHFSQAADEDNDRNLNPNNSPEKPTSFSKSESIDLTSQQATIQNPQVSEYKENDENNEDEKEEVGGNQIYKGLNFNELEFIKTYIQKYKTLCDEFEKDYQNPENLQYYLLSQAFINEWKEYVSYDQLLRGDPPLKNFGKAFPQYFNKDLLDDYSANGEELVYRNEEERSELKPGLQEGVDFQIINKEMIDFFKAEFHGREIMRRAYILPDGHKRVEIYYKKVIFFKKILFKEKFIQIIF